MTMDWSLITQLVGSIGFPIVACVALFTQMNKQSQQHKEEMDEMRKSIDNNTLALTRLLTKLDAE